MSRHDLLAHMPELALAAAFVIASCERGHRDLREEAVRTVARAKVDRLSTMRGTPDSIVGSIRAPMSASRAATEDSARVNAWLEDRTGSDGSPPQTVNAPSPVGARP